ncbi:hypothetical protein CRG98_043812 [Punica granatum]|uniref:PROP1-like PPR domain-containing protein n=1 Tax=Punica granatum TaxID=22663 RepID=A0A2I0HVQ7_PUNGR|nr:hypothetical protein CRG98_043812 [Punica granatum]
MIRGLSQSDEPASAIDLYRSMRRRGLAPSNSTFIFLFKACGRTGSLVCGEALHVHALKLGVGQHVFVSNALICTYYGCGRVELARKVFDEMPERDLVSWNSLICGYNRAVEYVEREKVEVDVYLGNTLIDFYGKRAGDLASAQALFDQMPRRDVISWTSMITGYAQANCFSDSVKLFQDMMAAKVKPDKVTVASVLSACAHLGSLGIGRAVHDYIRSHNVKTDVYVGNALIDMYCKCASIEKAFEVFREMKDQKDEISWTSIIAGLAVNGYADQALELFLEMSTEGIKPTHGTFVGILLACSHAGLVDKGLEFFRSMEEVHGLRPEMKHYGCVVDLLSRSGNLERAYEFITEMPVSPDIVIWRILLSACKIHGNVAMAEIVTKKLLELDPSNSGNYVLLSNAYASLDRWHDATSVRDWMEESDVHKPSAWSSIESNKPPSHSSMRSPLHF